MMKYQGSILDGFMHGEGRLTYENGEYYDGQWVRGKAWLVTSFFPQRTSSLKPYTSGKRHGRGEYRYADGTKYIGNWDNDRIHGEGSCWYPNGNRQVRMSN